MRTIPALMHIMMAVAVAVTVVLGTDVFHFVGGAALGTALDGAVARAGEPDDVVGVRWGACAAEVLLVAEGADGYWVFEGACADIIIQRS